MFNPTHRNNHSKGGLSATSRFSNILAAKITGRKLGTFRRTGGRTHVTLPWIFDHDVADMRASQVGDGGGDKEVKGLASIRHEGPPPSASTPSTAPSTI